MGRFKNKKHCPGSRRHWDATGLPPVQSRGIPVRCLKHSGVAFAPKCSKNVSGMPRKCSRGIPGASQPGPGGAKMVTSSPTQPMEFAPSQIQSDAAPCRENTSCKSAPRNAQKNTLCVASPCLPLQGLGGEGTGLDRAGVSRTNHKNVPKNVSNTCP
jgi:hypothetical protein